MSNSLMQFSFLIERAVPGMVFVLLSLWTIALFVEVPYAGFDFNPADGLVTVVYDKRDETILQVGDRLLQVDAMTWKAFKSNLYQPLFVKMAQGQVISLRIQRGEQEKSLAWVYPGFTSAEFLARFLSEWWLAYVFWLIGTATWLFLRPKDGRWRLLVAFNFVTAIALSGGSQLSRWHVWAGAIKLVSLTWACMLVYLHLHTIFPQPLGKVPTFFWSIAYFVVGMLVVAELFRFLPSSLFFWGVLLGGGGTLLLLALQFWSQPSKRRDMILIIAAAMLALLPIITAGFIRLFGLSSAIAGLGLLALPIWPLAYFYVAARGQFGELELRANRLISLYAFLILLGTLILVLVPPMLSLFPTKPIWVAIATGLLISLLSVMGFMPFERYFERHILGIPWRPERLLENYAAQITLSLDLDRLLALLQHKILPSLLIRQSMLIEITASDQNRVLSTMGLDDHPLPTNKDLPDLLTQIGSSRKPVVPSFPWLRVLLPLQIEGQTIGLWLLGQRDPDDFYAHSELTTLQAIANQTAIALTNIEMTQRLHTLHQANIDRQESERTHLARDLHDVVLNQLAVLRADIESQFEPHFDETYRPLTQYIRQMIKGLRPPLLSYGLQPALEQLIDDFSQRNDSSGPLWEPDFPVSEREVRYDRSIEQHLFRIVQQACENALRHAQANIIQVTGHFAPALVELTIEDDGIGFDTNEALDLTYFLSHQHYGIIGMLERAELIGAVVRVESTPQRGTTVHVTWSAPVHLFD